MSKATSSRPSNLLAIEDDPLAAFCFDRAVFTFGTTLQGELNSIKAKTDQEKKHKTDLVLRKWLPETAQKFADPASRMKKK